MLAGTRAGFAFLSDVLIRCLGCLMSSLTGCWCVSPSSCVGFYNQICALQVPRMQSDDPAAVRQASSTHGANGAASTSGNGASPLHAATDAALGKNGGAESAPHGEAVAREHLQPLGDVQRHERLDAGVQSEGQSWDDEPWGRSQDELDWAESADASMSVDGGSRPKGLSIEFSHVAFSYDAERPVRLGLVACSPGPRRICMLFDTLSHA
jgi:hypothetical protein